MIKQFEEYVDELYGVLRFTKEEVGQVNEKRKNAKVDSFYNKYIK